MSINPRLTSFPQVGHSFNPQVLGSSPSGGTETKQQSSFIHRLWLGPADQQPRRGSSLAACICPGSSTPWRARAGRRRSWPTDPRRRSSWQPTSETSARSHREPQGRHGRRGQGHRGTAHRGLTATGAAVSGSARCQDRRTGRQRPGQVLQIQHLPPATRATRRLLIGQTDVLLECPQVLTTYGIHDVTDMNHVQRRRCAWAGAAPQPLAWRIGERLGGPERDRAHARSPSSRRCSSSTLISLQIGNTPAAMTAVVGATRGIAGLIRGTRSGCHPRFDDEADSQQRHP